MDQQTLDTLLPEVIKTALGAGELIQDNKTEARANPIIKKDKSRVTIADRMAEDFISEKLNALTPDISLIGEEAVEAGQAPTVESDRFWLTDPLDGTELFIKGEDSYSVNIGLVLDNEAKLGVLYFPDKGELFAAAGDKAWYMATPASEPEPFIPGPANDQDIKVVLTKSDLESSDVSDFLSQFEPAQIETGGTEKFYRVATNDVDMYVRFTKCYEWDIVAGHAILNALGGKVKLIHGAPYPYNNKSGNYRCPPFVAYSPAMTARIF